MPKFHYQGQTYDFSKLREKDLGIHPAFTFCHRWLNGQSNFLLRTSGSTGKPKLIELSRWQMEASIKNTARALNLDSKDKALVCINTSYIGGMMMLARSLMLEMEALLLPPESNPLAQVPSDFQPSFIAVVPLQLSRALNHARSREVLENSNSVIVGGAPVSDNLEEKLQLISTPIYSTYGMTETVSHVALRRLNGAKRSKNYCLLDNIEACVDEMGRLKLRGDVTRGRWLQTNDLAELSADHRSFQWKGRADQVINSGGVKVPVSEVESKANEWLKQKGLEWEAVIIGLPDTTLGEKITLVLCRHRDIEYSEVLNEKAESLIQHLKSELPPYHAPKHFLWIAELPLTPTQKVDRTQLKQVFRANSL